MTVLINSIPINDPKFKELRIHLSGLIEHDSEGHRLLNKIGGNYTGENPIEKIKKVKMFASPRKSLSEKSDSLRQANPLKEKESDQRKQNLRKINLAVICEDAQIEVTENNFNE